MLLKNLYNKTNQATHREETFESQVRILEQHLKEVQCKILQITRIIFVLDFFFEHIFTLLFRCTKHLQNTASYYKLSKQSSMRIAFQYIFLLQNLGRLKNHIW